MLLWPGVVQSMHINNTNRDAFLCIVLHRFHYTQINAFECFAVCFFFLSTTSKWNLISPQTREINNNKNVYTLESLIIIINKIRAVYLDSIVSCVRQKIIRKSGIETIQIQSHSFCCCSDFFIINYHLVTDRENRK